MGLWGRLPRPGHGAIVGGRPSAPESHQPERARVGRGGKKNPDATHGSARHLPSAAQRSSTAHGSSAQLHPDPTRQRLRSPTQTDGQPRPRHWALRSDQDQGSQLPLLSTSEQVSQVSNPFGRTWPPRLSQLQTAQVLGDCLARLVRQPHTVARPPLVGQHHGDDGGGGGVTQVQGRTEQVFDGDLCIGSRPSILPGQYSTGGWVWPLMRVEASDDYAAD